MGIWTRSLNFGSTLEFLGASQEFTAESNKSILAVVHSVYHFLHQTHRNTVFSYTIPAPR